MDLVKDRRGFFCISVSGKVFAFSDAISEEASRLVGKLTFVVTGAGD